VNNQETVELCAIIAQVAPAQKFDELTPVMWQPILEDVRMVDAKTALRSLAARLSFIAPADIVQEVKRIRRQRVEEGPAFDPRAYPGCDDPAVYAHAIRDHVRRIADGEPPKQAPPLALTTRPVAELIADLSERLDAKQ
jgi:hypothetical protein